LLYNITKKIDNKNKMTSNSITGVVGMNHDILIPQAPSVMESHEKSIDLAPASLSIANDKSTSFEAFFDKYHLEIKNPADLDFLQENISEYTHQKDWGKLKINRQLHYIRLAGLERLINAERMKKIIKEHHLELISVVEYSMFKLEDRVFIACPAISDKNIDSPYPIMLPKNVLQQIVELVKLTCYSDFFGYNLVQDKSTDKWIFVDLEDVSFYDVVSQDRNLSFPLVKDILKMCQKTFQESSYYRPNKEADDWLEMECEKYKDLDITTQRLHKNSDYDEEFDLEIIKQSKTEFNLV